MTKLKKFIKLRLKYWNKVCIWLLSHHGVRRQIQYGCSKLILITFSCGYHIKRQLTYRVFIKYCVFSLKCCDFSELCQFYCGAGVWPAIVYTHRHRGETERGQSPEYILKSSKNTIFNEHPVPYLIRGSNQTNEKANTYISIITYADDIHLCYACIISKRCQLPNLWKCQKHTWTIHKRFENI